MALPVVPSVYLEDRVLPLRDSVAVKVVDGNNPRLFHSVAVHSIICKRFSRNVPLQFYGYVPRHLLGLGLPTGKPVFQAPTTNKAACNSMMIGTVVATDASVALIQFNHSIILYVK